MTAAPTFDKPAPAAATLARTGVDWERHEGTGAPKILPPPGVEWRSPSGKTVQKHRYYTRVTTFAKAIDDINKLMAWKMRGVLVGLGQRPDYVIAAAALTMSDDDRKAADELAELAVKAAKGDGAALVGTAIHTWTERLDRGEPLGYVPDQVRPLVDAYAQLTAPITFAHRECRTVCDDLEVAGTPDGIGTCSIPDPDGVVDGLRIIDTKSGKVSYPGPMSCQLAAYARSDLYDPATGTRTPLEEVNQRWGLIVHVQQDGKVTPGLYWLNLEHGNQGLELARQVRSWRKVKPQAVLLPVAEVTAPDAVDGLAVEDTVVTSQGEEQAEDQEPAAGPCVCGHARSGHSAEGQCRRKAGACPCPGYTTAPVAGGDEPAAHRFAAGAIQHGVTLCATCEMVAEDHRAGHIVGPIGSAEPQEDDEAAADGTDPQCNQLCVMGNEVLSGGGYYDIAAHAHPECPRHASVPEDPLEPQRQAIRAAVTTRDLGVLWESGGAEWPADLVELAAARHRELKAQEDAARPRAALAAALSTASGLELKALWLQHGGTELWTDEHTAAAEARWRELSEVAA